MCLEMSYMVFYRLKSCSVLFLSHCSLGINLDNHATLFTAVAHISVLTEIQLTPTSLQGESQMSKCFITVVCSNAHIHSVVMGGIKNCGSVFLISHLSISTKSLADRDSV